MRIWVSTHCRDRYYERVSNIPPDGGFTMKIINNITNGKDITEKIFDEAPRYILYLHEKYGEVGQRIIEHDQVIYLLKRQKETKDTFTAITCFKNEDFLSQFKNTSMSRSEIYIKIKLAKAANKKKNH